MCILFFKENEEFIDKSTINDNINRVWSVKECAEIFGKWYSNNSYHYCLSLILLGNLKIKKLQSKDFLSEQSTK